MFKPGRAWCQVYITAYVTACRLVPLFARHSRSDNCKPQQAATGCLLRQAVPHCDPFMLSLQPDCQQDAQTFRTQIAVSQREVRFLTESAKQMSLQHATVFTLLCNHPRLRLQKLVLASNQYLS